MMHIDRLLNDAWLALEREDFITAARMYAEAAGETPTDPYVNMGLGASLYSLGRFSEALTAYLKSLHYESDNVRILLGISLCYYPIVLSASLITQPCTSNSPLFIGRTRTIRTHYE